jgi:sugar phosphate isomerase/epimerase
MLTAITVCLFDEGRSGPFVLHDSFESSYAQGAALGFDAIELFCGSAADLPIAKLRELQSRQPMSISAVGSGAGWVKHRLTLSHPDAKLRQRAIDFVADFIVAAAAIQAPVIIGSMQGRADGAVSRKQAFEFLGVAFQRLNEVAAGVDQRLLIEPLNRYETNLINTLDDAAGLIDGYRLSHVSILADLFHMNIEERDIVKSLGEHARRIGHVHWADSNRRAMGLGHSDAKAIGKALTQIGYAGYLSAEVFPQPNSAEAAKRSIESMNACR